MLTFIHREDGQGQTPVLFLHCVPGLLHRLHVQPLWQLQDRAGQVPACLTPLPWQVRPSQHGPGSHQPASSAQVIPPCMCDQAGTFPLCCSLRVSGLAPA